MIRWYLLFASLALSLKIKQKSMDKSIKATKGGEVGLKNKAMTSNIKPPAIRFCGLEESLKRLIERKSIEKQILANKVSEST